MFVVVSANKWFQNGESDRGVNCQRKGKLDFHYITNSFTFIAGMEPVINLAMNMRERKREIGEERPMIDPKTENLVGNWSSGEVLKISTSIHHSKMAAFFTKVWVK